MLTVEGNRGQSANGFDCGMFRLGRKRMRRSMSERRKLEDGYRAPTTRV